MTDLVHLGTLLLQGAIVVTLLEGVRGRDVAAVVNALVALGAALLPAILEITLGVGVGPELPLWLAAAGFLHALGMLGPYDSIWWWDHLTHAISAALVAALVYAGLIVVARQSGGFVPLPGGIGGLTVLFTFVAGVFWELIELVARDVGDRLDVEPVLVHYGWRDTALDLVFDLGGALGVVLLDLRLFVPLADRFPDTTRTLLTGSTGVFLVGSVLLALVVGLGDGD